MTSTPDSHVSSRFDLQMLLDAMVDEAVYLLDPRGRVVTWNAGAERLKGYAAKDVVGRTVEMFYPPEDVVSGVPFDEIELAERYGCYSFEGWRVRRDGTRFRVSSSVRAICEAEGQLVGFTRVTRHVDSRRTGDTVLPALSSHLTEDPIAAVEVGGERERS
ncbi:MAG: PAS domain-containing protein [Gemmatimonadaceae bacterium]|nr:PAS domain-containing protein [Gemmatimonadaceae bacterium]